MTSNTEPLAGLDVPIVRLQPRSERLVSPKQIKRIEASLKAVGLIEPLIVYPQGDNYEILDGCLRYRILLEMGVETVPCLIWKHREAFTSNRMVNRLSASQEMCMLRKSLEELDEQTIAEALGMKGISHRLNTGLLKKLHPQVVQAFEANQLGLRCVKELAYVKPERQLEIWKLMRSCNDYGTAFVRGLVVKTPPAQRVKTNGSGGPWKQKVQPKKALLDKLKEVEQQQDFYAGLYRQYTTNLLKLVIYVRTLLANTNARSLLEQRYPEKLNLFEQIINETEA